MLFRSPSRISRGLAAQHAPEPTALLLSRCAFHFLPTRTCHEPSPQIEARIAIDSLAVISGKLPPRAMGLVAEWTTLHQQDLTVLWDKARRFEPLARLDPLP